MIKKFLKTTLIIALTVLCYHQLAVAETTVGGITVVVPEDGATVQPGSTVEWVIEVDPAIDVDSVRVWPNMSTKIPPLDLTTSPYEGSIEIPNNLSGPIEIGTILRTTSMDLIEGPTITLHVIPSDSPIDIKTSEYMWLSYPGPYGIGSEQLKVYGTYPDGSGRDITGPQFGTTFTSTDTNIATVSDIGVVTAVSPGVAFIKVENSSIAKFSKIVVRDADTRWFPSIDLTNKTTVTGSGFRKDIETGLFVQEASIRNDDQLPIPVPLVVVVSNLPEGVELNNQNGTTDDMAPIGSSYKIVNSDISKEFLMPGEYDTVLLEFKNSQGRSITYDLNVYYGTSR